MILRRTMAVVLTALGALALAGCSEPILGGTGLRVQEGRVQAVVQMCPGVTASEVRLTTEDGSAEGQTIWKFDSAEVANVDLGTVDEFLDLVGDRRMEVSSNASEGWGGWVEFDAAALRDLEDGQILSHSTEVFYAMRENGPLPDC